MDGEAPPPAPSGSPLFFRLVEAAKAIEEGKTDPNQMCCCGPPAHTGGRIGVVLERVVAPQLVKKPVAAVVCVLFLGWFGICAWQANNLAVQDRAARMW